MNLEEEKRREIVLSARRLSKTGLVERTWGNVSARLNDDTLLITPTGTSYTKLKGSNLSKVNSHTLLKKSGDEPSSELSLHAKIYNIFPKANVILHTHQRWASILSLFCNGKKGTIEIPESQEKTSCFSLFSAEYAKAGTEKIAQNVIDVIREKTDRNINEISSSQALMARHGVVTFANDFRSAFLMVEELEKLAKIMLQSTFNKHKICISLDIQSSHSLLNSFSIEKKNN